MTTVAIGAGGLAAGLAAAGAVGLGLAAAGALFGRGGRRRGGRRRGHGRRRGREVQEDSESEVLQRVLSLIRQQDITGCGMRLVCELAGLREQDLDEEQKAILNLVETPLTPGEGVLPVGGPADYSRAKILGSTEGNCAAFYPQCPMNSAQMMQLIDSYIP